MGRLKAGLSVGAPKQQKTLFVQIPAPEERIVIQEYNDAPIYRKLDDLQHEYALSINKTKEFFAEKAQGLVDLELRVNALEQKHIPEQSEIDKAVNKANSVLLVVEDQLNKMKQDLSKLEPVKQEIVKHEVTKEVRVEQKMPVWAIVSLALQAFAIVSIILLK